MIYNPVANIVIYSAIYEDLPLWFLFTLFFVRIFGQRLLSSRFAPVWALLSLAIAYGLDKLYPLPILWGGSIFLGLFFYCAGYWLRDMQYRKHIFAIAVAAYILIYVFCPSHVDFRSDHCSDGYFIAFVVSALAACVTFNNLAKVLPIRFIASIGRDSMSYYVIHFPIIILINYIFNLLGMSQDRWTVVGTCCVALLVILPLFNRWYLRHWPAIESRIARWLRLTPPTPAPA